MAPRRSVRSVKSVNTINYSDRLLSDALCPICRCILIQPVTLPCNHDYCLPCFEGTLANANLTCPLCRVRFGSWHRTAKKDNKVINEKLWDVLQHKFPNHVKNRLQGVEENFEEANFIKITSPGEIRKEYEAQRRKQELEVQKQNELEEKASAELIKKLREQEDYEETVREEKLRLDEQVARQIAKEMGFIPKPSVSKIVDTPKKRRPIEKFIKNMKINVPKVESKNKTKPIPQYLTNIINKEKTNKQKNLMNFAVEITDSNDSIENECRYFKPIDHRNIPPSKTGTVLRVPALMKKPSSLNIVTPNRNINFIHNSNTSAFARFEMSSPILNTTSSETATSSKALQGRKRKASENLPVDRVRTNVIRKRLDLNESEKAFIRCVKNLKSPSKQNVAPKKKVNVRNLSTESDNGKSEVESTHRMTLREKKPSSPLQGFDINKAEISLKFNGQKSKVDAKIEDSKAKQEEEDLAFAKKLQEQFNKERYTTRSSITCRDNIKSTRQVTLTEIMSTSKCK